MQSENLEVKPIDQNHQEITYQTEKRIVTLKDLLEVSKVDLDEWEMERHSLNKWESFTTDENGEPVPFPLYQVKASFKRKNPIAIFPVVQPLSINITPYTQTEVALKDIELAMVASDLHIGFRKNLDTGALTPFHDRKAIAFMINLARDTQPAQIIINGDGLDMAMFGDKFLKESEFANTTMASFVEYAWVLGQLRLACPNSKIVIMQGNHEYRLKKSLVVNYTEAYGLKTVDDRQLPLFSLQNLLNLDKIGVECIEDPDEAYWINKNLAVRHGNQTKKENGQTVRELLKDIRCSVLVGHCHRLETIAKTVEGHDTKKTYSASSFGCMCRIDGTVPGSEHNNWTNGLGMISYEKGNGFFAVNPVVIYEGRGIYNGKMYEGKNYRNQLQAETHRNF